MIYHAHGRNWVDFGQFDCLKAKKEQTFWSIDLNLLSILTFDFLFLWTGLNFELVLNFSNLSSPPVLTIFWLLVPTFIPIMVFIVSKLKNNIGRSHPNNLCKISETVNGSKPLIKHYCAILYIYEYKIAQKRILDFLGIKVETSLTSDWLTSDWSKFEVALFCWCATFLQSFLFLWNL